MAKATLWLTLDYGHPHFSALPPLQHSDFDTKNLWCHTAQKIAVRVKMLTAGHCWGHSCRCLALAEALVSDGA
uniref:Uncharacterized protein n=1 Tax=Globisporangium ultimum (strain ATCC 200006 / CBS 805.95 / DAOM BR144) TaxID=431595 RepID=K3WZZ6_GLOUD